MSLTTGPPPGDIWRIIGQKQICERWFLAETKANNVFLCLLLFLHPESSEVLFNWYVRKQNFELTDGVII